VFVFVSVSVPVSGSISIFRYIHAGYLKNLQFFATCMIPHLVHSFIDVARDSSTF
jgi:hypothetical protein